MKPAQALEMFYINDKDFKQSKDLNNFFYSTKNILPSKYEGVKDFEAVAIQQDHLMSNQQQKLLEIFKGHKCLFKDKLSCYPGKKIHLDLKPSSKPHHLSSANLTMTTF